MALWPDLQTTTSAGMQDSNDLHTVTPRVGRIHPETPHNLHTSKEIAHIADRVPGILGVNALPEVLSATNARGWDTMAGFVAPNLRTGPKQSRKTIHIKATYETWEQVSGDCMLEYIPVYLTSMAETLQISAVPVCNIHSCLTPGKHIRS